MIRSHFSSLTLDREAEIKQRVGARIRAQLIAENVISADVFSAIDACQQQM